MSSKINLQQLAKILAQKKSIPQKDAEAFLKEFFDSIVQNVTSEKLVKIKGLGTFKLIEVLDRESVNVNTGERIVIPGHSKLSFAPETALKDLINKPFADFQTTVINEGTSIEEMERVPQEAPSSDQSTEEEGSWEPEVEEKTALPPLEEEKEHEEAVPIQKFVEEPKEVPAEEPKEVPAEEPKEVPVEESKEEPVDEAEADEAKKPHFIVKFALWLGAALLLCVVAYLAFRSCSDGSSKSEKVEQVEVEAPVEEAPAPKIEYAQVPGGEYRIVGTRKTHVMKPGEFITRIAIEEYGNKDFAPYIIVHNAFPDPDNVPVDMEIKLPELEKIE